ncbi:MAG: hypothetical protein GQ525_14275 [Draconibacterium sp.]|nr:hypothetical protein [Draconibacterium sp.]
MGRILFKEEQRFTQWWLRLILVGSLFAVLAPFSYGIYLQEVLDVPFGDNPMSTEGLLVTGISSLLIVGLIFGIIIRSKLKTKITSDSVLVMYPPFIRKWKSFVPEEIEKFEVRTYKAIREYGGYGIKRRHKHGQSYTISGNVGLQLYLKNGKKLLIGTQKKQAMEYAMGKLMNIEKLSGGNKIKTTKSETGSFRKTKKFLILFVIELVAILIFIIIQIFNVN